MSANNCSPLAKYDSEMKCPQGANLKVLTYWESKTSVLLDSATMRWGCVWSSRSSGWEGRRDEILHVVLCAAQGMLQTTGEAYH